MTTRHVACVAEGDYVRHAAAMLHSVLAHGEAEALHVHWLHGDDLRARDRMALERWLDGRDAAVTFHAVPDARVAGLPTEGFTGRATWYRILLPELLAEVDRVLFLDADVIVCDALTELWETDLAGAYLGAVTNVLPPEYQDRPAAMGLAAPDQYFNAGVLLMDLELMRRDDCTAALHRFGVEHAADLVLRDQDALNAVLAHRRAPLDPRWNVMNVFWWPLAETVFAADALERARRDPAIRHFEGPAENKPWHPRCGWDRRELYFEHRRGTPWPRARLEGPRRARPSRELVLYTLIGGSGVALDLLLFFLLFNAAGVHEVAATAISTTAGITNNFVLNALFNFRRRDDLLRRFARFYAVGLLGLALVAGLLLVFSTWLGVDANVIKVLSLPLVLALQYTLNARWSFRA